MAQQSPCRLQASWLFRGLGRFIVLPHGASLKGERAGGCPLWVKSRHVRCLTRSLRRRCKERLRFPPFEVHSDIGLESNSIPSRARDTNAMTSDILLIERDRIAWLL